MDYQGTQMTIKQRISENHFTGCLLGGAIGDALGAPVEFMALEVIRRQYGPQGVTDYIEYPDHTGEFTDDTQMTLFTAEGLLRANHRAVLNPHLTWAANWPLLPMATHRGTSAPEHLLQLLST